MNEKQKQKNEHIISIQQILDLLNQKCLNNSSLFD